MTLPSPAPKAWIAEFVGTFALVFVGTGAIVVDSVSGGAIRHLGISLAFGAVVGLMIAIFGRVSGAHLNPAVTVALASAGRFRASGAAGYIAAQLLGALAASALLRFLFPASETLGATLPSGHLSGAFVAEVAATALLVLTILGVTNTWGESSGLPAIAIGSAVALVAGPVSGASLNPARSIGPAVVGGEFDHLWLYLLAPLCGALLAVPLCATTCGKACCTRTATVSKSN
ncbi:MAG TPA: aquaporin [Bacteroidia bacterium]|nr:aquaporin [Bacteroidia bacterium]